MTDKPSDRLAAVLSQCDEFWMAGISRQLGQPNANPQGTGARDDSYHRLVSDLIKQQIERDTSDDGDNPSRITDYLDEYDDVSFSDSTLLDLVEHEFISRHRGGDWPDIDEYVRKFPHLELALHSRLQNARDDVVTHTSVCSVLAESGSAPPE